VKVRVIDDRCQGHGRCYALAPTLFESDDYGNAHEVNGGEVPPGLEDQARLAADNCPEFAIEIDGVVPGH
jgi:ferredoxin